MILTNTCDLTLLQLYSWKGARHKTIERFHQSHQTLLNLKHISLSPVDLVAHDSTFTPCGLCHHFLPAVYSHNFLQRSITRSPDNLTESVPPPTMSCSHVKSRDLSHTAVAFTKCELTTASSQHCKQQQIRLWLQEVKFLRKHLSFSFLETKG